jgi:hypothetical protein
MKANHLKQKKLDFSSFRQFNYVPAYLSLDIDFIYFLIEYPNHLIPFRPEYAANIFQPLTLEFWIVWV